jgi:hypothetical protein
MRLIEYLFLPPGPLGAAFARWGGVVLWAYVVLGVAILLFTEAMFILNGRHGLKNHVTRRARLWGLAMQIAGIALLGLRVANIPILSMRVLLYAQLAGEIVLAGYFLWWLRERYPDLLAAYDYEERRRAYLPRAAGGAVESPRRRAAARRRR